MTILSIIDIIFAQISLFYILQHFLKEISFFTFLSSTTVVSLPLFGIGLIYVPGSYQSGKWITDDEYSDSSSILTRTSTPIMLEYHEVTVMTSSMTSKSISSHQIHLYQQLSGQL